MSQTNRQNNTFWYSVTDICVFQTLFWFGLFFLHFMNVRCECTKSSLIYRLNEKHICLIACRKINEPKNNNKHTSYHMSMQFIIKFSFMYMCRNFPTWFYLNVESANYINYDTICNFPQIINGRKIFVFSHFFRLKSIYS